MFSCGLPAIIPLPFKGIIASLESYTGKRGEYKTPQATSPASLKESYTGKRGEYKTDGGGVGGADSESYTGKRGEYKTHRLHSLFLAWESYTGKRGEYKTIKCRRMLMLGNLTPENGGNTKRFGRGSGFGVGILHRKTGGIQNSVVPASVLGLESYTGKRGNAKFSALVVDSPKFPSFPSAPLPLRRHSCRSQAPLGNDGDGRPRWRHFFQSIQTSESSGRTRRIFSKSRKCHPAPSLPRAPFRGGKPRIRR